MPPESATENSVPFVEIFSETPAIPEYLKEKFMKETVCPLWNYFPKIQQYQNT